MLRNTIIFAVQTSIENFVATIFAKCIADDLPRIAVVMFVEPLHIFKDEYLGIAFLDYSGEFTKQGSPCIFESQLISYCRKRLAWSTSNQQIDLAIIRCRIKGMHIIVPSIFFNIIVGKIGLFAFVIYVTSEHDLCFEPQSLKGILNGTYTTKRRGQVNGGLKV